MVETQAARPAIDRARGALLVIGCEVPLAKGRCGIAIVLENSGNRRRALLGQVALYPGQPPANSAILPNPTA